MWQARYAALQTRRLAGYILAFIVLFFFSPAPATGQLPPRLSDDATVSLLTIYPAAPIYSAFAHSAFRFRDDSLGVDVVFNYGTFDDRDPLFLPKFIYGRMDYSLSANWTNEVLRGWDQVGRSVVEQTLRLSSQSTNELYARVLENYRPENRVYRYDFLFENCATILLDLLHETDGINLTTDSSFVAPESFRQLLQPYISGRPFYDAGIALALGSTVDRIAAYEERSFLPLELLELVRHASVNHSEELGTESLEVSLDTLIWKGTGFEANPSFPKLAVLIWILVLGLIIAGIIRKRPPTVKSLFDRWFFGTLGFVGIILAGLWFVTAHHVTDLNLNLAWALPFHLWPALFWNRMSEHVRHRYFLVTLVLLILLLVGQLFLPQLLHPVFLPIVVLAAWRSIVLVRSTKNYPL